MSVSTADVIARLEATIAARRGADPATSYVARQLARGPRKCAEKFGEEAVETVIAAVAEGRDKLVAESADAIFHLMILWASLDVTAGEVFDELARREGISGITEKAARAKSLEE